jgi:outer membrane protein assembly factor BamA
VILPCRVWRSQRNLFGLNQKLSALVELGQADSLFRLQWVDPWLQGDATRTSRTVSIMNTRWGLLCE